jgi:UDP-N-acetylglucosamine--N-acetylmuramyl-(pentapeptide) pyrophosphoryl-undecaprenol N-acetylglucosamine transferase
MKVKKFMNQQRHKRIIISGGGTGGHVFPAISIANALTRLEPETEILFVGALGRLEMEKVPEAGYRIIGLPVEGLIRKLTLGNFRVIYKIFKSLSQARKIIDDFKPDVVVGVGGFASGPVLWQAERAGIPVLIQEQNSYAGVTNKLLSRKAGKICVAYEGMQKYFHAEKIIMTGNPVRHDFENINLHRNEALKFFGLREDQPVVVVLGGSLGAGSINKCLSDDLKKLGGSSCQWLWQSGRYYFERVNDLVKPSGYTNVHVHGFINRMDYAFAAADVIVSRAGAGTISELCLVGKPVILVPSPNVAEDHQTRNARALSEKGAAILIPDHMAPESLVDEAVKLTVNEEKKRSLSANISGMAEREADLRIANEVLRLIGR